MKLIIRNLRRDKRKHLQGGPHFGIQKYIKNYCTRINVTIKLSLVTNLFNIILKIVLLFRQLAYRLSIRQKINNHVYYSKSLLQ